MVPPLEEIDLPGAERDPRLAHDTEQTVAEARQLWWLVDRPNLFIKISATIAGLPAITDQRHPALQQVKAICSASALVGLAQRRYISKRTIGDLARGEATPSDDQVLFFTTPALGTRFRSRRAYASARSRTPAGLLPTLVAALMIA